MQQTMVHKAKEKTMNSMRLEFDAVSANEGLARMAAAAFVAELDPTLEEISDVKTAVSEAVTNAIIHGYEGEPGKVYAFIMTDICDFHLINDYWGYETGNEVLQSVLKEMKHLKGTVFAYRFHSDIFVSVVDVAGEDTETFEKKLTSHYGKMTGEVLENYPIEYFSLKH